LRFKSALEFVFALPLPLSELQPLRPSAASKIMPSDDLVKTTVPFILGARPSRPPLIERIKESGRDGRAHSSYSLLALFASISQHERNEFINTSRRSSQATALNDGTSRRSR
jgi:hypothetical protein